MRTTDQEIQDTLTLTAVQTDMLAAKLSDEYVRRTCDRYAETHRHFQSARSADENQNAQRRGVRLRKG